MHGPFFARKGPTVGDFDGDGRPELVAVDRDWQFCRFRQGSGADGCRVLEPGEPLAFESGAIISVRTFLDLTGFHVANLCIEACDWTGDGRLDLIVSTNPHTYLLENVGTVQAPLFAEPKLFTEPSGKTITVTWHESHGTACDWDRDDRLDLIVGHFDSRQISIITHADSTKSPTRRFSTWPRL